MWRPPESDHSRGSPKTSSLPEPMPEAYTPATKGGVARTRQRLLAPAEPGTAAPAPPAPGRAAEVLEAQRRLQILGHDDASDLVERPVRGALDRIGREPLANAARTEVDLQSKAGVPAADTLRLDPGAEVVDAGLQEDRLIGRRSVTPAIAEGA